MFLQLPICTYIYLYTHTHIYTYCIILYYIILYYTIFYINIRSIDCQSQTDTFSPPLSGILDANHSLCILAQCENRLVYTCSRIYEMWPPYNRWTMSSRRRIANELRLIYDAKQLLIKPLYGRHIHYMERLLSECFVSLASRFLFIYGHIFLIYRYRFLFYLLVHIFNFFFFINRLIENCFSLNWLINHR